MASLYEILSGGLKGDQDYYNQDPFYNAGIGFAKTEDIKPTTNAEALWIPAVKGLLSGAMVGYGKKKSTDAAFEDYRNNPLVKALGGDTYSNEERPEGWTANRSKQDLAFAALGMQQADEKRKAQLEQRDAIEKLLLGKGATIDLTKFTPGAPLTNDAIVPLKTLQDIEVGTEREKELAKKGVENSLGLSRGDASKVELDMTTKLTTGAEAQKTLELQTRAKQVLGAIDKQDPIRAATAIYGFAKILDPQGVVRKEDGTIVADPGGPAGQLASIANNIMQKGRLTQETIQSMKEIVPMLVEGQYQTYSSLKDALSEAAQKQGASPDRIGYIKPLALSSAPVNKVVGGRSYRKVSGGWEAVE